MSQTESEKGHKRIEDPPDDVKFVLNKIKGDVSGTVFQVGKVGGDLRFEIHLSETDRQGLLDVAAMRHQAAGSDAFPLKSLPRTELRPQQSECAGRGHQLVSLRERLAARQHVLLCGPPGIGKTSLLDHASAEGVLCADAVPHCEGLLSLIVGHMSPDDVVRELVLKYYDVKTPAIVSARRLLRELRALVVLDDVDWSPAQISEMLDAMPLSVFVIATRQAAPSPRLRSLALGGLSSADAVELVENRLERPMSGEEAHLVERARYRCDGNPGQLAQLASAMDLALVQGETPEDLGGAEASLIVPLLLSWAGEPADTVLRTMLLFPEVSWGRVLLHDLHDGDLDGLTKLVDARLVSEIDVGDRRRYRVAGNVVSTLPPPANDDGWRFADRVTTWVTESGPGLLAGELGVVERVVHRMIEHGQQRSALVLARIVAAKLLPSLWWDRGDRVLELGLRAARDLGSRDDVAYFGCALAIRKAADERLEGDLELLIALIESSHDDQQIAGQVSELRAEPPHEAKPFPREPNAVSGLGQRIPLLNNVVHPVAELVKNYPAESRNLLVGIVALAGVLFGLPSSSAPSAAPHDTPAPAAESPHLPTVVAAPADVHNEPIAPASAAQPTVPPPSSARPEPTAGTTTTPPGRPPETSSAAGTDYHYAKSPDLIGDWQLDFTRTNFGTIGVPDRYTIALHRLDDGKCGGEPPCYGGQWVHGDHLEGNSVVMKAAPAPTGFTGDEPDACGAQHYDGTVVSDDTRQPLSYRGNWTCSNGWKATFVFTRLS